MRLKLLIYGKPTDRRLLNAMNSYTNVIQHMNIADLRFAMLMRYNLDPGEEVTAS